MKINRTLYVSIAVTAMAMSSLTSSAQELRELRNGVRAGQLPASTLMKAPENASYKANLIGFVYYAESWNDLPDNEYTPMGIYTIDVTPGSQPQRFAQIGQASSHCNGGAVLAGDTYWYIWDQTDPSGQNAYRITQLYSYNITTGEAIKHGEVPNDLVSIADKAWDPVSGKIYGQIKDGDNYKLCIFDYEERTVTNVADMEYSYGLAFDAEGQLYGIDGTGTLNKIDKSTGKTTKVGSTGVTPSYAQSMTIDPKTGDIWWASYSKPQSSVLYRVDKNTGKATAVTEFKDHEEIMGLGVMPAIAPDNAPGYATNLSLKTDKASTSAEVTFTLPAYTFMGDPLKGEIKWTVYANDNTLINGTGTAGAEISKTVTLPTGSVNIKVECSNAEGTGPAAEITRWIGQGYPVKPQNVKLTLDENTGKMSLSWDAVTEGENGGYVAPENVTYKVIGMPGNREVGTNITSTSVTEIIEEPQAPVEYYYTVTACNDWRESDPAESNRIPYGKGLPMPYDNSFSDASSLALFSIIDGNNDASTWKWSKYNNQTAYIFTGTDVEGDQDDWLITPGLDMKAGNRYQLTYHTCGNIGNGRFFDLLEVGYGIGVDPSKYTIVEEKYEYDINDTHCRHDVIVEPKEDGYYHFAFHAVSNCKAGLAMYLDDMHIDNIANEDGPAAVSNLTAKTSKGTAPITVSFTTPDKTVKGDKLSSLTKVELWRNHSELVTSETSVKPGKKMTLTDNKGGKGETIYTVVAYNENGVGERAETQIYIGLDVPGAPLNITLSDLGGGNLKLTWDEPEIGARGGYFDPANLKYNVYSVVNGFAVKHTLNMSEKELVLTQSSYYDKNQSLVVYGVSSINTTGESGIGSSSEVIVGESYSYPFEESWVKSVAQHDFWYRSNSGENGWYPTEGNGSDNDNGLMQFIPAADGDMSYISLGKIDMSKAKKAKLIFDYYAVPGANAFIQPEINRAFRDGWYQCQPIDFNRLHEAEGWREYVIDLKEFMSYPYISIRFLGGGKAGLPICIDNVRVMDSDKAGITSVANDTDEGIYYDLTGLRVTNPQKGGIYILRHSNGQVTKMVK